MNGIMNHIMTCLLPVIFSVPLVVVAGGVTALATRLEGTKNSATLHGTTADSMIRSASEASEDARVHPSARSREVTSRAGTSPQLPFR